jgi:hypothetical protein
MRKMIKRYFALSYLGKSDNKFSKNDLIKHAAKFPKLDSLFLLSRIDVYLTQNHQFDNHVQEKLIAEIFPEEKGRQIKQAMKRNGFDTLFYSQQIYYAMGLVLLYGIDIEVGKIDIKKLLPKLGNFLLLVSEFCEEPPNLHMRDKQVLGILWQIGHFYNSLNLDLGAELGRAYLLYNSPEGKAFAQKFEEVTGIPLKTYWFVSYVIYIQCVLKSTPFIPEGVVFHTDIFSNLNDLDMVHVGKILQLLSEDVTNLKARYEKKLKSFGIDEFNFEFLREKPLLKIEDKKYICLSLPYLINKATTGILDIVKESIGAEQFSSDLNNVLGNSFEAYINALSVDSYNSLLAKRYLKNAKYKNVEICDGVIDYGDRAIFIEIKALSIQKRYRLSNKYDDIETALKPFLIEKGAAQLDKRITEFIKGKVKIKEINPNRINYYYPLIITGLDSLPQFNYLSEEYDNILKKYNILQQQQVARLTIITVREYEHIMQLIEQGYSFVEILVGKMNDNRFKFESMTNYLLANYPIPLQRPLHLQSILNTIGDDLKSRMTKSSR